jgi:hypothetical protein
MVRWSEGLRPTPHDLTDDQHRAFDFLLPIAGRRRDDGLPEMSDKRLLVSYAAMIRATASDHLNLFVL